MRIPELLDTPALDAVASALLHSLWIGAGIALLLAAALGTVLKRSTPRARCHAAGFALLLLVLATALVFQVSRVPTIFVAGRLSSGGVAVSALAADRSQPIPVAGTISSSVGSAPERLLALLWAVGAGMALLRTVGGWWRLRRLCRAARRVDDPGLCRAFDQIRARLGIHERVRLRVIDGIDSPMMAGFLWPAVLLPLALLQGTPAAYLQAVFAHELAHHRRWDYVANLLQCLVESLFFYHPAVWWISRVIREEREHACDDLAAEQSVGRNDYARALAWMESTRAVPADSCLPAPAMAMRPGSTAARIERLLKPRGRNSRSAWLPALSAATAGLAITAAMIASPPLPARATAATAPAAIKGGTTVVADTAAEKMFASIRRNIDHLNRIILYLDDSADSWARRRGGPLFASPVVIERGGQIIRLTEAEPRLFAELPNRYLLDHQLDVLDGALPMRDPDGDGFTVLEEFVAGTDPKSAASRPPLTEKLRFVSRRARLYRVRFDTIPDGRRAQLTREPSAIWSREVLFATEGDSTGDGQLRVEAVSPATVEVTHLPTGTRHQLAKGRTVEIPTWFAELRLNLAGEKAAPAFFVKQGERFALSAEPGRQYQLREVSTSGAVIAPVEEDKPTGKTIVIGAEKQAELGDPSPVRAIPPKEKTG